MGNVRSDNGHGTGGEHTACPADKVSSIQGHHLAFAN
jgi:hypothetical protein